MIKVDHKFWKWTFDGVENFFLVLFSVKMSGNFQRNRKNLRNWKKNAYLMEIFDKKNFGKIYKI